MNPIPEKDRFDLLATGYLTGTLDPGEAKEFLSLLPAHEGALDEMERAYAAGFLPHFAAEKASAPVPGGTAARNAAGDKPSPRLRRIITAAAACLAFVALGASTLWLLHERRADRAFAAARETTLTVPRGSRLKAVLPDGSTVWLNSGSRLRYNSDFGREERHVSLDGEGLFNVKKDPGRPFTVEAGEMAVRVTGTAFNLRNYETDSLATVHLVNGRVAVSCEPSGATATLVPDQVASLDKRTGRMVVRNADARRSTDWTDGRLTFDNVSFPTLLKDIERHFDVRIELEGSDLDNESFSGSINLSMPLGEILDYIDVDHKFTWQREGDLIRIHKKPNK